MSDYRLKVSVRNANILRAIEADGCSSVAGFCKKWGIYSHYIPISGLISMRSPPMTKGGVLTKTATILCETLCVLPEDLWTEDQLYLWLPKNTSTIDVSEDDLQRTIAALDARKIVKQLSNHGSSHSPLRLTPREKLAIERLHDDAETTLEEAGRELGVTREQARKIGEKGMRKMAGAYARQLDAGKISKI